DVEAMIRIDPGEATVRLELVGRDLLLAVGEVTNVPDARLHGDVVAEEARDGSGLGGRFDDDERARHTFFVLTTVWVRRSSRGPERRRSQARRTTATAVACRRRQATLGSGRAVDEHVLRGVRPSLIRGIDTWRSPTAVRRAWPA